MFLLSPNYTLDLTLLYSGLIWATVVFSSQNLLQSVPINERLILK